MVLAGTHTSTQGKRFLAWVDWVIRFVEYAQQQNIIFQIVLLVLALSIATPFYLVERVFGYKTAPTIVTSTDSCRRGSFVTTFWLLC